jgi:hypothetical protein
MQIHQELRYSTVLLGDFASGGVVGTSNVTVDAVPAISISQSTVSKVLSLPSPVDATHSLLTQVNNIGTASFVMHGTTVESKSSAFFIFTNGSWQSIATKSTDLWLDRGMPNALLTGSATVSFSGSSELSWEGRFIALGGGRGIGTSSINGYFDISLPPAGTQVLGFGGAPNVTTNSSGIPLSGWSQVWYELPANRASASLPVNFRTTLYTADFTVPNNWVLIASHNADYGVVKLGTGDSLYPNTLKSELQVRAGGTVQAGTVAGGIIPRGYSVYADANANWNPNITLPSVANRTGDIFTINHTASISSSVLTTYTNMTTPYVLTLNNRGAAFIWLGSLWSRIA